MAARAQQAVTERVDAAVLSVNHRRVEPSPDRILVEAQAEELLVAQQALLPFGQLDDRPRSFA